MTQAERITKMMIIENIIKQLQKTGKHSISIATEYLKKLNTPITGNCTHSEVAAILTDHLKNLYGPNFPESFFDKFKVA